MTKTKMIASSELDSLNLKVSKLQAENSYLVIKDQRMSLLADKLLPLAKVNPETGEVSLPW